MKNSFFHVSSVLVMGALLSLFALAACSSSSSGDDDVADVTTLRFSLQKSNSTSDYGRSAAGTRALASGSKVTIAISGDYEATDEAVVGPEGEAVFSFKDVPVNAYINIEARMEEGSEKWVGGKYYQRVQEDGFAATITLVPFTSYSTTPHIKLTVKGQDFMVDASGASAAGTASDIALDTALVFSAWYDAAGTIPLPYYNATYKWTINAFGKSIEKTSSVPYLNTSLKALGITADDRDSATAALIKFLVMYSFWDTTSPTAHEVRVSVD